jgi:hypothetical protein
MQHSTTVSQNRIERLLQLLSTNSQNDRLNRAVDSKADTQHLPQSIEIRGVSRKSGRHANEKAMLHNACSCGSSVGKFGAGRKPGELSISCRNCGKFIEYSPIQKLKQLHKRKQLTDCLEILETKEFQGDEAIFLLALVGGEV